MLSGLEEYEGVPIWEPQLLFGFESTGKEVRAHKEPKNYWETEIEFRDTYLEMNGYYEDEISGHDNYINDDFLNEDKLYGEQISKV